MWNIEYLNAEGKGFSDKEPWVEKGIEKEDDLREILRNLKEKGCKNIKIINTKSIGWHLLSEEKPKYYEPVLCLLKNDFQVTASLDENNTTWVMYNHDVLEDEVVAWKELDDIKVADLTIS